jgi:hypothetical protein
MCTFIFHNYILCKKLFFNTVKHILFVFSMVSCGKLSSKFSRNTKITVEVFQIVHIVSKEKFVHNKQKIQVLLAHLS